MSGKWIVYENHIAIDNGDEILHPEAKEIFEFMTANGEAAFSSPSRDLPDVRFAKVGAPIKCELISDEKGKIFVELYALRKGKKCTVDMIQGYIMDHSYDEGEWFYLTGDIEAIQEMLRKANILSAGEIGVGQYIDLIKQDYFAEHKEIINSVNYDVINSAFSTEGNPPKELCAKLYEYQRIGYLWMKQMLELSHGCILGDEMGLGKTLQIITVFQELKNREETPLLVVAPVSLLENWKRECHKFAPELDVYIHHGSKRTGRSTELIKHDVVVISYNTSISDMSMLKMIEWKCVVLDEAQNIKNPYSERAKAVKSLNRTRSVAVTGTPFENHITDIWSLADYVVPGLLGTLSTFQQNVSDDVLGAEKIEPILSPIMIRRLVKDVANDLPEKVVIPQPIEMSEEERSRYEEYRLEAVSSANNGTALSIALLQKLRMYCTHPAICEEETCKDPSENSIKYQRFCEIVDEIVNSNEKVIVFTSYKKMFELLRQDIPGRFGIKIDFINGDTPVEERQKIVDWFNSYEGPAMLALNPKAAGVGLNITGANHVIHYNLEWNPALEDQASARAYRRGQEKTVFIYRLFYADTVEQVVNERIERKREIASTAVVGNDGSSMDKNDILKALGISDI